MALISSSKYTSFARSLFQRFISKVKVNWQAKDYYDRLGVSRNASQDDIKKRYHEIARAYHPDVLKDPEEKKEGEKILAAVNDAYDVLKDEKSRRQYDMRSNGNPFAGGGGFNPNAANNPFYEQFFYSNPRQVFREMAHLTFEESAFGCQRLFTLNTTKSCPKCKGHGTKSGNPPEACPHCQGQGFTLNGFFMSPCQYCGGAGFFIKDPCHQCNGSGQVPDPSKITIDIPPGVENGTVLNFSTKKGDTVSVVCKVQDDPLLKRDGHDLHVTVPISIKTAILGGVVQIPTLKGLVNKRVSPGTQPNFVEKLNMGGIPPNGNLYIHYKIILPKSLSRKDKKNLEKMDEKYMKSTNDFWNSNLKSFQNRVCSYQKK